MVAATSIVPTLERHLCPSCRGSGEAAQVLPACGACGATFEQARFDAWIEGHDRGGALHWRRWRLPGWLAWCLHALSFIWPRGRTRYRWDCALPCGHDLLTALAFVPPRCNTCLGAGTVAHSDLAAHLNSSNRMCLIPRPTARQFPHNPAVTPMTNRAAAPVASYLGNVRYAQTPKPQPAKTNDSSAETRRRVIHNAGFL